MRSEPKAIDRTAMDAVTASVNEDSALAYLTRAKEERNAHVRQTMLVAAFDALQWAIELRARSL